MRAVQAYIHSRMRRRTADFLQGKHFEQVYFNITIANEIQYSTEPDQRTKKKRGKRPAGELSGFKDSRSRVACWQARACTITKSLQSGCVLAHAKPLPWNMTFVIRFAFEFCTLWDSQTPSYCNPKFLSFSISPIVPLPYISPQILQTRPQPSLHIQSPIPFSAFAVPRLV